MLKEVEHWLATRTWQTARHPPRQLCAFKQSTCQTVSLVLPALNEAETVGDIVRLIRGELMTPAIPLVDELVVMDSGSTDHTAAVARQAGARVIHRDNVLRRFPPRLGKGEVLWRSLLVTCGDIVCFMDADLRDPSPTFVSGIVEPLLTDPSVHFVKAMHERPLASVPGEGGRVTELMARPLLNLHWPLLAGFVQPLGGEYAARRSLLEKLPFPVGYGVELGLLIDALRATGLQGLGQVGVGVRKHRHHNGQELGRMAASIYYAHCRRLGNVPTRRPRFTQFISGSDGFVPHTSTVDTTERPPMATVPEYFTGVSGRREDRLSHIAAWSRHSHDSEQSPPPL